MKHISMCALNAGSYISSSLRFMNFRGFLVEYGINHVFLPEMHKRDVKSGNGLRDGSHRLTRTVTVVKID